VLALALAAWPVTSGVPLPRGVVKDVASLRLTDAQGREIPCQFTPLSRHWALDGSVRWVLLDFQIDLPANGSVTVWLSNDGPARAAPPPLRLADHGAGRWLLRWIRIPKEALP